MEGKREELRKGPWKAEEDEVLINHVRRYGPRDWSSIRSKGLLQRTGKSCRLRWVNKLRPNLKNGCKFTAEEERVVIELQAQFGNKWARIATYLPGRTDNDVKNFWSSRQKRLARVLQNSATPSSSNSKKPLKTKKEVHASRDVPTLEASFFSSPVEEESSLNSHLCTGSHVENTDRIQMNPLPDLFKQELPVCDANLVKFEPLSLIPFPEVPQSQPIITFSPESQELLARLEDPYLFDVFGQVDASHVGDGAQLSLGQPLFDPLANCMNDAKDVKDPAAPDVFLDDFPADMFDHIEPLPSPSRW